MMSGNGSCRLPFTAVQWQELEHQALFFKYMVSGLPIPPDLLFNIRRSFESSHSSKFLLQQPHHIGWNSFHMGFGRKVDPEPGRCRRTDGKKWRCSKDAYSDSKYCERHMHRGRNRSRKPVEIEIMSPATDTISSPHNSVLLGSSINNKKRNSSSPSTTTPEIGLSFQDYRKSSGDGDMDSEASSNCSWQLGPLTMGSPLSQMKQKAAHFSELQQKKQVHHYYNCDMHLNIERDDHQPKKVMHHFLDESPPKDKLAWLNFEDKMSIHSTQLSISTPNSLHDFFATQK